VAMVLEARGATVRIDLLNLLSIVVVIWETFGLEGAEVDSRSLDI
jgi:hypothetical protein